MKQNDATKLNAIGGQAVIEGVLMRGKDMYAMAVRKPDNDIEVVKKAVGKRRNWFLKLPVVRGIIAFIDSLVIGMKTMTQSAEIAGEDLLEDGEPSKFEQFLTKLLGDKLNDAIIYFSVAVGIVLALGLFTVLPVWIGSMLTQLFALKAWTIGIIEGIVRILIFLAYLLLVSRMKDIQRVFQYHGAEHKTINCIENGGELSVENVKAYSRLHKRCGTSFLLIVMIISMIFFTFVRTNDIWLRFLSRIVLIPFVAGVSYEVIKWAGMSKSVLVSIVSYPGMSLQKITTAEPDDAQIEVAIAALKCVLED